MTDLGVALVAATTGGMSGAAVSYLGASAIARRAEGGRRAAEARDALSKRLLAERTSIMAIFSEAAGHSGALHGLDPQRSESLAYDVVELLYPYPSRWADDVLDSLANVCGRIDVLMATDLPRPSLSEGRAGGWMRAGWLMSRGPELGTDNAAPGSLEVAWRTGLVDGGAAFNRLVTDLDIVRAAVGRGAPGRVRLRATRQVRSALARFPRRRSAGG
jgi:hypothetical protein